MQQTQAATVLAEQDGRAGHASVPGPNRGPRHREVIPRLPTALAERPLRPTCRAGGRKRPAATIAARLRHALQRVPAGSAQRAVLLTTRVLADGGAGKTVEEAAASRNATGVNLSGGMPSTWVASGPARFRSTSWRRTSTDGNRLAGTFTIVRRMMASNHTGILGFHCRGDTGSV
jgi:hypothetical protein